MKFTKIIIILLLLLLLISCEDDEMFNYEELIKIEKMNNLDLLNKLNDTKEEVLELTTNYNNTSNYINTITLEINKLENSIANKKKELDSINQEFSEIEKNYDHQDNIDEEFLLNVDLLLMSLLNSDERIKHIEESELASLNIIKSDEIIFSLYPINSEGSLLFSWNSYQMYPKFIGYGYFEEMFINSKYALTSASPYKGGTNFLVDRNNYEIIELFWGVISFNWNKDFDRLLILDENTDFTCNHLPEDLFGNYLSDATRRLRYYDTYTQLNVIIDNGSDEYYCSNIVLLNDNSGISYDRVYQDNLIIRMEYNWWCLEKY